MRKGIWFALLLACALAGFGHAALAGGVEDANAGIAALNRGNNDEAIGLFTQALNSGQLSVYNQAVVLNNRGLAWENKGDFDKTIADCSSAIRLNPQYANAFINRGGAWVKKHAYDKAIADLDEAIRLNPRDTRAFYNRGVAWGEKGEMDKAIADFDEAIRLNPRNADAFYYRGFAWRAKGDMDRANADFAEAARLNPQYAR